MPTSLLDELGKHRIYIGIVCLVLGTCLAGFVLEWPLTPAADLMNLMAMARNLDPWTTPPIGGSGLFEVNDVHYGISLLFISSIWRSIGNPSGQSLYRVFFATGLLSGVIMVTSFYLIGLEVMKSRERAALCALSALLFWGPLHTQYPGDYSITGIAYAGVLPQTLGIGLAILGVLFVMKFAATGRPRYVTLTGLFILLTMLNHLLSIIMLATGILAYISVHKIERNKFLLLAASTFAGVSLTLIWPYFRIADAILTELDGTENVVLLLLSGILFVVACFGITRLVIARLDRIEELMRKTSMEKILAVILIIWLLRTLLTSGLSLTGPTNHALIGISLFGLLSFVRKPTRMRSFLVLWAGINLLGYGVGQVADGAGIRIPYWHRLIFFAMFPLHLLLADYILQLWTVLGRRQRTISFAIIAIAVVGSNLHAFNLLNSRPVYLTEEIDDLASWIPRDAVVLSDGSTSSILAGWYGYRIVWPILHEKSSPDRWSLVHTLLNSSTSETYIASWIDEYETDYLVLPLQRPRGPEARHFDPEDVEILAKRYDVLYERIEENDRYILYSTGE